MSILIKLAIAVGVVFVVVMFVRNNRDEVGSGSAAPCVGCGSGSVQPGVGTGQPAPMTKSVVLEKASAFATGMGLKKGML